MTVYKKIWYSLQDDNLRDLDITVYEMIVCMRIWYSLQDDCLQDTNVTVCKIQM